VKATQLPAVMDLIARRQKLEAMLDAADLGLINLSVGAAIAGPDVVAVVRPVIMAEVRAQIAHVDRNLQALGVEVD
jgi:hypothetical protein